MDSSSPPILQPRSCSFRLHLFGALKDAIRRKRFGSDEEVIEEVKWPRMQDSDWYKTGIHALVSRWRKAVEVDGDYVQK
jgi:hypothetical protein